MTEINGGIWVSFQKEKPLTDGFYQVRFADTNDKGGVIFIVPHAMDPEHWKDCQWLKRMSVIPASEVEKLVEALEVAIETLPFRDWDGREKALDVLVEFQTQFPQFKSKDNQ